MIDFTILKYFGINVHPPKVLKILEIFWNPPHLHWVKCNTVEAAKACLSLAYCDGFFRNKDGDFIGGFVAPLDIQNSLFTELMAITFAIESAHEKHWNSL